MSRMAFCQECKEPLVFRNEEFVCPNCAEPDYVEIMLRDILDQKTTTIVPAICGEMSPTMTRPATGSASSKKTKRYATVISLTRHHRAVDRAYALGAVHGMICGVILSAAVYLGLWGHG